MTKVVTVLEAGLQQQLLSNRAALQTSPGEHTLNPSLSQRSIPSFVSPAPIADPQNHAPAAGKCVAVPLIHFANEAAQRAESPPPPPKRAPSPPMRVRNHELERMRS